MYAILRIFLRLSVILRKILRIQILAYLNRKLEILKKYKEAAFLYSTHNRQLNMQHSVLDVDLQSVAAL